MCGAQKREVNHWWVASIEAGVFLCREFDAQTWSNLDVRPVYAKDWRPRCKLRVYRVLPDGVQEGKILSDLELALAHPATIDEANAAWKRWMTERSIEILKRNGYRVNEEHE